MKVSLEDYVFDDVLTDVAVTMEALASSADEKGPFIYILLTHTGTWMSHVSKAITGDPYNHVSIMLEKDFDNIYTFSMKNNLNKTGGFLKEDRKDLNGAKYSLYRMAVTDEVHLRIRNRIGNYFENVRETAYNHFGLINAILKKGIFKDDDKAMICSQFVATVLHEAGVVMFKDRPLSTIRPYEFVKSKLMKFVERGTIKFK